jgi:hypothetical protein
VRFRASAQQLVAGGVGCGRTNHGFGEAVHFFRLGAELQQEQVHACALEFADAVGGGPSSSGWSAGCAATARASGPGASTFYVVCVSSCAIEQFTGKEDSRQGRVCRVVGVFPLIGRSH